MATASPGSSAPHLGNLHTYETPSTPPPQLPIILNSRGALSMQEKRMLAKLKLALKKLHRDDRCAISV